MATPLRGSVCMPRRGPAQKLALLTLVLGPAPQNRDTHPVSGPVRCFVAWAAQTHPPPGHVPDISGVSWPVTGGASLDFGQPNTSLRLV